MNTRKAVARARALLGETFAVPVPVVELAERQGIGVSYQPLDPQISGLLLRDGATATIVVNAQQHRCRHRFTIAHELGHFALHRGVFINSTVAVNMRAERHPGSWEQEAEANAFAAELLMPEPSVMDYARVHLDKHPAAGIEGLVHALASRFDVSEQAARIRLSTLGLLLSF